MLSVGTILFDELFNVHTTYMHCTYMGKHVSLTTYKSSQNETLMETPMGFNVNSRYYRMAGVVQWCGSEV